MILLSQLRSRFRLRARLLALALVVAALGMQAPGAARAQEPLRVVATVGMIADVAGEVGADCVDVTALMGPGVDPHLYRASAGDVRSMQGAELVLYGGLSLEGQMGEVLSRFGERTPTVAVSEEAIPEDALIETGGAYAVDPHVWMDVSLWARTAPAIADIVGELRPACADAAAQRADAFREQALALHEWIAAAVASLPEERRVLVTAHDAFAYYGRAYGLEVVGVQGISTEAEAGVADIREVADLVAEREVPALFVESTVNPRTVQAVIAAARQRGHEVEVGGELYADALGEAGTMAGTYLGMLYENTREIVTALGGEPPALPEALAPWADEWGLDDAG